MKEWTIEKKSWLIFFYGLWIGIVLALLTCYGYYIHRLPTKGDVNEAILYGVEFGYYNAIGGKSLEAAKKEMPLLK